jgi:hypothetical protein
MQVNIIEEKIMIKSVTATLNTEKQMKKITYTTGWIIALGIVYEKGSIHLVLPFIVIEIDFYKKWRNNTNRKYDI